MYIYIGECSPTLQRILLSAVDRCGVWVLIHLLMCDFNGPPNFRFPLLVLDLPRFSLATPLSLASCLSPLSFSLSEALLLRLISLRLSSIDESPSLRSLPIAELLRVSPRFPADLSLSRFPADLSLSAALISLSCCCGCAHLSLSLLLKSAQVQAKIRSKMRGARS